MERAPSLRAADVDREQAADRLRIATAEGRLSADELEQRLGALYSSRTYGELDVLLADLPTATSPAAPATSAAGWPRWPGAAVALTLILVVCGALGDAVRHSQAAAAAFGRERHFHFYGGAFAAHRSVGMVAPIVGLLAVAALIAVLMWLVRDPGATSDA